MDAYKIQVSMMLRNGVSAGLRLIRHDLGHVMKAMDGANKSTKDFGRSLIVAGAASAAFGAGILDVYEKIIRAGAKLVDQQAALKSVGVGAVGMKQYTAAAWKTSTSLFDVSPQQSMKTEAELRSLFGRGAAARNAITKALPAVLKADVGLDGLLGGHHGKSLILAIKAADITGALNKNGHLDPGALARVLPYIEQTMLITKGMLSASEILRTVRMGGPAAHSIDFKKLMAQIAEPVMALGPAVGRGLFQNYMALDVGRVSAVSANYLTRLGFVRGATMVKDGRAEFPSGTMHKVGGSSTYLFNPSNLVGAAYLKGHGLVDWVHKIAIPYLLKRGVAPANVIRDLTGMLPSSTSARLNSWVADDWPQQKRYKALYNWALKHGHPYWDVSHLKWGMSVDNFSKAWGGLVTALGVPQVKSAISVLNSMSASIHKLTFWLSKHPMVAKHIDQMMLALGAAFLAFGAILMSAGIVALLGTGGTLAAIATGIGIFMSALALMNWKTAGEAVSSAIHAIGNAMTWLMTPLRALGHFLGVGKAHPGASSTNIGLGNLRKPGFGGAHGQNVPLGAMPGYHYFSGDGGHWVRGAWGSESWAPGPPPSAQGGSTSSESHPVHVTNAGALAHAIKHGLAASLNQNQASTTGFNGRASAFGTPAFTGP